jgi:hypothetical protein
MFPTPFHVNNHPVITNECLKKFPIGKKSVPQNGIAVLFNKKTTGGVYRPCLTQYSISLELDTQDWPVSIQKRLRIKIHHNGGSSDVTIKQNDKTIPFIKSDSFLTFAWNDLNFKKPIDVYASSIDIGLTEIVIEAIP